MAAKKTAQPSKSEFVRSLPADMPAKEVVAKAKAAGLALAEDYVYSIRSKGRKGKRPPVKGAAPVQRSSTGAESKSMAKDAVVAGLETLMRRVANEVLDERLGSLLKK